MLGDGVNVNDVDTDIASDGITNLVEPNTHFHTAFPYVDFCPSGRDLETHRSRRKPGCRRHGRSLPGAIARSSTFKLPRGPATIVEGPRGGQPRRFMKIKMKTLVVALVLAFCAMGTAGAAEGPSPSPAELRIAGAQKVLQKQPNRYQAYNDLALALVRRARETGDNSYYEQAQAAIDNSLRIEPRNFEAHQAHVNLLLAEHEYRQALDEARALNHRMPDAVLVWGYKAEAEAALGNYQQAEESAQWMMNLRPGNLPAYLTGADLREDWGDIDGAEDYLSKALQQTPPFESEETAWIPQRRWPDSCANRDASMRPMGWHRGR